MNLKYVWTLLLTFSCLSWDCWAQETSPTRPNAQSNTNALLSTPPNSYVDDAGDDDDDSKLTSKTNRISFIMGPGASYITDRLYDIPIVNQTNDIVMINTATRIKSNLAVGIIYTPYIWDITRNVRYIDSNGRVKGRKEIESVPRGRTIAAFINPLAFNRITENQPFFNMLDFGVGYGHRFAGGLVILGTAEFFSVRQPRKWFIGDYGSNTRKYEVGGSAQKAFDSNDNSIFTNKPVVTFGFKICYSFDIIRSFVTGANNVSSIGSANTNPSSSGTPKTQQPPGTTPTP